MTFERTVKKIDRTAKKNIWKKYLTRSSTERIEHQTAVKTSGRKSNHVTRSSYTTRETAINDDDKDNDKDDEGEDDDHSTAEIFSRRTTTTTTAINDDDYSDDKGTVRGFSR